MFDGFTLLSCELRHIYSTEFQVSTCNNKDTSYGGLNCMLNLKEFVFTFTYVYVCVCV